MGNVVMTLSVNHNKNRAPELVCMAMFRKHET